MAASQVVLYFDRQEDALLFTLAASSVIAPDESGRAEEAVVKVGKEICKASRITTEGILNPASSDREKPGKSHGKCA
jgi:hypothetical protein